MALIIGSSQDKREYAAAKGLKREDVDPSIVPRDEEASSVEVLGENVVPLSDDELTMLKRVHLRRDSFTVYMQPDIDFYDMFYRDDNVIDELTAAARQIKRVYSNADDYFYALDVRDAYIDMVIDRDFNGSAYRYNRALDSGDVWEPPKPYYSRKARDYDMVSQGIRYMPKISKTIVNEELANHVLQQMIEDRGIDQTKPLETYQGVVTDYWLIDEMEEDSKNEGIKSSTGRIVMSVTDLDKVRSTLEDVYNNRVQKPKGIFSQSKAAIEKSYWDSFKVNLEDIKREIEAEKVEDNTAMVYDPVTNRPMQRGEYKRRKLVREMKAVGWSELPVMKALDVGSGYERRQLEKRNAQVRKLKKQARAILEDAGAIQPAPSNTSMSFDSGGFDPLFDPMDALAKYFQGGST